ncbi:unnamed protein product [Kuraishia capsulata CBS 1993]|uniref:Uncharacterized protein n=1 Tax=Kuraishia capsulata CBS 1993 TaxID=1382522 RepID=W6MMW7_9ASCO|nr:uncharacterized protein KUCA_T00003911001 [Kuraishia capsulata CBS 1993]CDK27931.1 unnamed protein product [Kuraishia capsulata CBS 1993]
MFDYIMGNKPVPTTSAVTSPPSTTTTTSTTIANQQHQQYRLGHDAIELDYESLPSNSPILAQLTAGAFAGIMEHTVMYPVDAVKTRMQMGKSASLPTGIIAAVSRISSTEGARVLWRGVSSVVVGSGPAHALYFLVFESTKTHLCEWTLGLNTKKLVTNENHPLIAAVSGIAATIASDALMTPFDVIKQRMQASSKFLRQSASSTPKPVSPANNVIAAATGPNIHLLEVTKHMYKNEGLASFYVSYPATLMMNIPFAALNFGIYEYISSVLNPSHAYDPMLHCIAGGVSGAFAAAVTTPLDCVKTALQTRSLSRDPNIVNAKGFKDAATAIWKANGYAGFVRGLRPRVVFNVPSTAISWTAYEMAKAYLLS